MEGTLNTPLPAGYRSERLDRANLPDAVEVYARTWKRNGAIAVLHMERHALYPDFRGSIVRTNAGQAVAFIYGTRSEPGQWWHDLVVAQLPDRQALQDCWVLTELAVLPEHQGHGLGSYLHDAALGGLNYPRATLSTQVGNDRARRFYASRGWRTLVPSMIFTPGGEAFTILGRELEGRQQ